MIGNKVPRKDEEEQTRCVLISEVGSNKEGEAGGSGAPPLQSAHRRAIHQKLLFPGPGVWSDDCESCTAVVLSPV